ncbi:MAG: redoxin domain-containing protein [Flavobacteriales bacterium]|nr:redoxin domain-containing protein [Flavobacteriales bacterium]
MTRRYLLVLFASVALVGVYAQPTLLPSIGLAALPADSDPVCTLPMQTPPIGNVGRPEGEQAADFTLYDIDGNAFNLEDALLQGKPVLMISSSYTCPVFRNKVPKINQLVASYSSQLHIVVVYTPEAHPAMDISPYFGAVNTGQQNIDAGILYEQPESYGERKAVLQAMLDSMQVDAPIYLDGPCNEWWNYYGPQPNNAYLIDLNGTIHTHHDWFDKLPEDIDCDIEDLLALPPTGDCGGETFGGHFNVQWVSNDTVYGTGGTTITAHLKLFNTSATDDVLIRMVKLQTNLPNGWQTSLCLDVCYLPDVDTAIVPIAAGDTMHFYYYFYSAPGDTIGYTRVGMRNEYDFSNGFSREVWGVSEGSVGMEEASLVSPLVVAPNPATDRITVIGASPDDAFEVRDMMGRTVLRFTGPTAEVSVLAKGHYLLTRMSGSGRASRMRVVKY